MEDGVHSDLRSQLRRAQRWEDIFPSFIFLSAKPGPGRWETGKWDKKIGDRRIADCEMTKHTSRLSGSEERNILQYNEVVHRA
ncbi:MAG TPA: hypothetical protein VJ810_06875 [Blastocatellia bacterium]|nr:hypothetical protein [Blastocatellia bacterium]